MWRLQKCCCCLGLRKGCILIAILDFFSNVLVLNFAETKFIGHIEQAVAICHCIGCIFLLGGALIVSRIPGSSTTIPKFILIKCRDRLSF